MRNRLMRDTVSYIMAYEHGELDDGETLDMFARLVKSGMAWTLQGHYGRTASILIQRGYITHDGVLTGKEIK